MLASAHLKQQRPPHSCSPPCCCYFHGNCQRQIANREQTRERGEREREERERGERERREREREKKREREHKDPISIIWEVNKQRKLKAILGNPTSGSFFFFPPFFVAVAEVMCFTVSLTSFRVFYTVWCIG